MVIISGAMTAKQQLSMIQTIDRKIDCLTFEIDGIRYAVDYMNDMMRNAPIPFGNDHPNMRYIIKWKAMKTEIEAERDKLVSEKQRIIDLVKSVPDERYVLLLLRRYVKGESIEQIADAMGYSVDYMAKLYGKAMKAFNDMLEAF